MRASFKSSLFDFDGLYQFSSFSKKAIATRKCHLVYGEICSVPYWSNIYHHSKIPFICFTKGTMWHSEFHLLSLKIRLTACARSGVFLLWTPHFLDSHHFKEWFVCIEMYWLRSTAFLENEREVMIRISLWRRTQRRTEEIPRGVWSKKTSRNPWRLTGSLLKCLQWPGLIRCWS